MIDKSKNYRTRDGREVRIYATDGGGYWPVHGAIQLSSSGWAPVSWDNDGNGCNLFHRDSLIEVRPRHKRTVWLHVFKNSTVCATEEAYYEITNRIACIKVELDFQEGEGL
jgi:hypothetical protein